MTSLNICSMQIDHAKMLNLYVERHKVTFSSLAVVTALPVTVLYIVIP
jgi:hypothetical protein